MIKLCAMGIYLLNVICLYTMSTEFQRQVWDACKKISTGSVSTYSEIAKAIRNPGASRAVGNALNKNTSASVPCHRVVCSDGKIGGYARGSVAKEAKLRKESVDIENGRVVDFEKTRWKF